MTKPDNPFESNAQFSNHEAQWIALSDLMTGLMMIFMLISIAFMVRVEAEAAKIKKVAVIYDQARQDLYKQLTTEFKKDLPIWGAEITQDLSVRFKEPSVLFDTGKDTLKPTFQTILHDFFPRYVQIITSSKYKNMIAEIRIEGHTSSVWTAFASPEEAYYSNMELSQSRTRSTLRYVLGLPEVQKDSEWLRQNVTANGLSSSHPILDKDGKENMERSRRVEFRIRTDADSRIATILQSVQ
jgi:outer membrane protein OmpA-like peptidoglycan-associated protein